MFDTHLSLPEALSLSGSKQSDYKNLRQGGVYLVDKTDYIPRLTQRGAVVFRRPCRSGKSLTVSMLKYNFYGLTQLFEGTKVYNSTVHFNNDWIWCPSKPEEHYFPPCPVIHLDFSVMGNTAEEFKERLITRLKDISVDEKVLLEDHSLDSPDSALIALINALVRSPWNKWKKVSEYIYTYIYKIGCITRYAQCVVADVYSCICAVIIILTLTMCLSAGRDPDRRVRYPSE